jgi:hypothetical protein
VAFGLRSDNTGGFMLKKTSLLLLFVFVIGTAIAFANIQPGNFHQMGTSARMQLSGSATNGNITLFDGNTRVASGTYRVDGDLLVVNFTGHGTDYFHIVSRTELQCNFGTWRRM